MNLPAMYLKNVRTTQNPAPRWLRFTKGRTEFLPQAPATFDDDVIDADGAYLFPVLRDAHVHFFGHGFYRLKHGLFDVNNADSLLKKLGNLPSGKNNVRMGFGWDGDWEINRQWLDEHSESNSAIFLHARDGHRMFANTRGFELIGAPLTDSALLKDPWPGKSWEHTGQVEDTLSYYQAAEKDFFRMGIGEIWEAGDELPRLKELSKFYAQGKLKIFYRGCFPHRQHLWTQMHAAELNQPRCEFWGYKLFLDGSLGSKTAWSKLQASTGILDIAELKSTLEFARSKNLVPVVHAIGELAVEETLRILKDVRWAPFPAPAQLEHAELWNQSALDLAREIRPLISVQPMHLLSDQKILPGDAFTSWNTEHSYPKALPLKTLLKNGLRLVMGSDTPVENPNPSRNWEAMNLLAPEERLSHSEFLSCYSSSQGILNGNFCLRKTSQGFDSDSLLTVLQGEVVYLP